MAKAPFTGVVHCYSSSPALGHAAVEMGMYLGIGGILTFKRSDELRATVRDLPLDRLLLETDAPYLAPEPHRGKRNEPAHVALVAARLAELKNMAVAEIERATTASFFRLFAKASPPEDAACG
jgi:TatD DNase family protein